MCLTMQSPLRFARKGHRIDLWDIKNVCVCVFGGEVGGTDKGLKRHDPCFRLKPTLRKAVDKRDNHGCELSTNYSYFQKIPTLLLKL